jgi:hypothetical protein
MYNLNWDLWDDCIKGKNRPDLLSSNLIKNNFTIFDWDLDDYFVMSEAITKNKDRSNTLKTILDE